MHAAQLGAESAKIEHSRLLWSEGHHRKAIQSLEGAIKSNAFKSHNHASVQESVTTLGTVQELEQNYLMAKVRCLLISLMRAGELICDRRICFWLNGSIPLDKRTLKAFS